MLKMHEIREIIKLIDQSGVTHFELDNEGAKLLIKKEHMTPSVPQVVKEAVPTVPPVAPVAQKPIRTTPEVATVQQSNNEPIATDVDNDQGYLKITSPMVGTFYAAPNPDAKPFVSVGDTVDKNTVVCIVEAMKLFNEIEAEVKGKIVKVLVENGQLVEYGQPLFLVSQE